MKPLLLALLISLSANAQSIEEKLKAMVLKIETQKAIENGRLLTDAQFVSFQYRLIPIKVKWKELYEVFITFRGQMRLLDDETYPLLVKQDKLNGTHKADSLVASLIREEREKNKPTSKEEAHVKAKYENADPSQQIYEVTYELRYIQSGQKVQSDKQRISFYKEDLSEVHFFK